MCERLSFCAIYCRLPCRGVGGSNKKGVQYSLRELRVMKSSVVRKRSVEEQHPKNQQASLWGHMVMVGSIVYQRVCVKDLRWENQQRVQGSSMQQVSGLR